MSNLSIVVHVMLNANVFVYTWKNNALEKNFDNRQLDNQSTGCSTGQKQDCDETRGCRCRAEIADGGRQTDDFLL